MHTSTFRFSSTSSKASSWHPTPGLWSQGPHRVREANVQKTYFIAVQTPLGRERDASSIPREGANQRRGFPPATGLEEGLRFWVTEGWTHTATEMGGTTRSFHDRDCSWLQRETSTPTTHTHTHSCSAGSRPAPRASPAHLGLDTLQSHICWHLLPHFRNIKNENFMFSSHK